MLSKQPPVCNICLTLKAVKGKIYYNNRCFLRKNTINSYIRQNNSKLYKNFSENKDYCLIYRTKGVAFIKFNTVIIPYYFLDIIE